MDQQLKTCVAFEGHQCIAKGEIGHVAREVKEFVDRQPHYTTVLVFDADTSERIEFDLRGSVDDVLDRLPLPTATVANDEAISKGPGRPKLGVVAREVTLLPDHWEWLNSQRGGASVVLRRLVTEARRTNDRQGAARKAQEAAYRFVSIMAGDLQDFEEASRALFAGDFDRFVEQTSTWPTDVRDHARGLVKRSVAGESISAA